MQATCLHASNLFALTETTLNIEPHMRVTAYTHVIFASFLIEFFDYIQVSVVSVVL